MRGHSPSPSPLLPPKRVVHVSDEPEAPSEECARQGSAKLFVDVVVVEGRGLSCGKDKVRVSACLESQPDVRMVTESRATSDCVWNSDASLVSAAGDRLHVSLITKRNAVLGKCCLAVLPTTGGPRTFWYNLRDVCDCACSEDVPLSGPDDALPFGASSAGRIRLQIEVSQVAQSMFLAKKGMPVRQLPYRIQAGDLLFFSSAKLVTTGTKIATRSQWDHVAIALLYKDYKKLYVLQSTMSGVAVVEIEALLRSYWETSRALGVRRLLRPVDVSFDAALSKFAEANVGKSYNFNLIQMLGKKKSSLRSVKSADSLTSEAESEKLFCSELVAAAYMSCGAIQSTAVASNFLPATFAESKLLDVFASGFQLMGLLHFSLHSKSKDVMWARNETHLKRLFREFVVSGAKPPELERKSEAAMLLKELRKKSLVVTMYPREASDELELSFEEGDQILVLEKDASDWWTGQHCESGRIGLFPANHCALATTISSKKKRKTIRRSGSDLRKSPSSPTGSGRAAGDEIAVANPQSPPAPQRQAAVAGAGCSVCNGPFSAGEQVVDLASAQLHERCLPAMLNRSLAPERCAFCNERRKAEVLCIECKRSVCDGCAADGRCKVCSWQPNIAADAKPTSFLVATKGYAIGKSKNDLSFEKGHDLELFGTTDFGYLIGRTLDSASFGLFPASADAAIIVKKFSIRGLRKTLTRKKSGRLAISGGVPQLATAAAATAAAPVSPENSVLGKSPPPPIAAAAGLADKMVATPRGLAPAVPPLPRTASVYSSLVQDEAALTWRRNLQLELSASDSEEDSIESLTDSEGGGEGSGSGGAPVAVHAGGKDEEEDQEEESSGGK